MSLNKVIKTELPLHSLLHERMSSTDFVDCYSVESELSPRKAAEIITRFPSWARFLMQLRGVITSPFGLSNDGPEADDKLGAFPVELENKHELIAGFNDKHLDFRVSVMSKDGQVSLATWVHTNNIGGQLYLMAILPFHILIARNALARIRALSTSS